jgi:hypothetical protein
LGTLESVYAPPSNTAPAQVGTPDAGTRNQRYNYLVGRLRNRQLTMEEATELFTLMQAMLARANELARVAAYRASPASAGASTPPPPPSPAAPSSSDDLLLVGILAMGAGAGLLAALARRMGDPNPPAPSGSGRSTPSATSR